MTHIKKFDGFELVNEFLMNHYTINWTKILQKYPVEINFTHENKEYQLVVQGNGKATQDAWLTKVVNSNIPEFEKDDEIAMTFEVGSATEPFVLVNYSLMRRNNKANYKTTGNKTKSIIVSGKEITVVPNDANNTGSEYYKKVLEPGHGNSLAVFKDYSVLNEDYSENGFTWKSKSDVKPLTHKLQEDTEFNNLIKAGIRYAMNKYKVDANDVWDALKSNIH